MRTSRRSLSLVATCVVGLLLGGSVALAAPPGSPPTAKPDATDPGLRTFRTWLQQKFPGAGWDEGPARFKSAAVEDAYPFQSFYFVFTHTLGIRPRAANSLSLVARVDAQGNVERLDQLSLDTYRHGLIPVKKASDARRAAAAVLTLAFGDPSGSRTPIKAGGLKIQHGTGGWVCSYPHDPSRSSSVRFDPKGILAAISTNSAPVP